MTNELHNSSILLSAHNFNDLPFDVCEHKVHSDTGRTIRSVISGTEIRPRMRCPILRVNTVRLRAISDCKQSYLAQL